MIRLTMTAALVVALVLAPSTSLADASLTVRVDGLHSSNGQVGCTLYNSARGYPTDSNAALQRHWCPIAGGASTCVFDPVPAGTYAVACIHDENKNGKLDTGLFGIPKEGTVASNQAKGFMGPPSFDKAKFTFSGNATTMTLHMGY
jgi:uncharacterized protein (DUF2141 family)